jgi:hypothetical protein
VYVNLDCDVGGSNSILIFIIIILIIIIVFTPRVGSFLITIGCDLRGNWLRYE